MSRPLLVRLHAISASVALLLIACFLIATTAVEAFGSPAATARVKTGIAFALLALVPVMAVAGATGFRLAGGRLKGIIGRKALRMKVIAANGVLVLVPAALFLAVRARSGQFDAVFMLVQAVEVAAGAANIALLSLNLREGIILGRAARAGRAALSARSAP
jgi:hypothetical protein